MNFYTPDARKAARRTTLFLVTGAAFLILSIGFAAWALRHVADDNKRLRSDQAHSRTLIEQLSSALDAASRGDAPVRTSQDIVNSVRTDGQNSPDKPDKTPGHRPDSPATVSSLSFYRTGSVQAISTGPR